MAGEMRVAVLQLAFAGLGAHFAVSSAWHDNHASLGVSRSLGYVENGIDLHVRDDRVDRLQRMILAVERWRAVARPDVRVVDSTNASRSSGWSEPRQSSSSVETRSTAS